VRGFAEGPADNRSSRVWGQRRMIELTTITGKVDLIGYIASLLVLLTFTMRSMIWLRLFGLASNFAFINYAILAELPPIFMLHIVLIAINAVRVAELWRGEAGSGLAKEKK